VVSLALGQFWVSAVLLGVVAVTAVLRCGLRTLRSLAPTFLHRNYCLHVGALLAAGGADRSGALVLLGVGACIDNLRETRVVARLRMTATGHATAQGQWTRRQLGAGWLACLACLLLAVLACMLAPISILPDGSVLRWVAHMQRSVIPAVASEAEARGGLMTAAAVAYILVIELGLTWKSTACFAGAPRDGLLIRSPAAITVIAAGSVSMFYMFKVGIFWGAAMATATSPELVYDRLGYPTIIGFFLWGYYGIMTTMRFGRSAGKPHAAELEGPSRPP
jgi:hypothetical protein